MSTCRPSRPDLFRASSCLSPPGAVFVFPSHPSSSRSRRAEPEQSRRRHPRRSPLAAPPRSLAPQAAPPRPPPPPPVPELGRAPSTAESACDTAAAITAPPEVCPAVDLLLAVSVFFKRPLKSTACDPVKLMLPLVSRVRRVSTRVPSHAAALAAVARHGLPLRGLGPSLHAR